MSGMKRAIFACTALGAGLLLVGAGASFAMNQVANGISNRIGVLDGMSLAAAPGLPNTLTDAARYTGPMEPINILIVGSDTREGQGPGYGNAPGFNGDTTMLMHVNASHTAAIVMSIPRDLLVDIPECKASDGTVYPASRGKFNSALPRGGPDCVVKTVSGLTRIPIHHVVVINFTGFADMVDAVGGLTVCLSDPIDDWWAQAHFPAGEQTVDGKQALALARVRKTIGDGSDISRINRQQQLLTALYQQVRDRGLLNDPVATYRLAEAAASHIATDPALASAPALAGLAKQLLDISPSDIRWMTVPWIDAGDGENVLLDEVTAQPIFDALASDTPLPPRRPHKQTAKPAGSQGACTKPLFR